MPQDHRQVSTSPSAGSRSSVDAFLSRLMLRPFAPADEQDDELDGFERLDVMDGLHRAVTKPRRR